VLLLQDTSLLSSWWMQMMAKLRLAIIKLVENDPRQRMKLVANRQLPINEAAGCRISLKCNRIQFAIFVPFIWVTCDDLRRLGIGWRHFPRKGSVHSDDLMPRLKFS